MSPGVLAGVRVLELDALGPAPFAAMVLADMGAEVVRVERPGRSDRPDSFGRGRRSVVLDLKQPGGRDMALSLADRADVLIEGHRPGVMERLGLSPDVCLARNPRLIFGRMTGWGQDGPLAATAGHDINFVAQAGALEPIGRTGQIPVPPLALVGDFGGGGMAMALGICAALVERARSGLGQVVDASCLDGASLLMTIVHHLRAVGRWSDERGTNLFDSGAPFYEVYETADGRHVAVGAVEGRFYRSLVATLGLGEDMFPQHDRARWPERKKIVAAVFAERTRAEWSRRFAGVAACFSPVLTPAEAAGHPQNRFVDVDGFPEPAPAPRFSRTPSIPRGRPASSADADAVLEDWVRSTIEDLPRTGAVG